MKTIFQKIKDQQGFVILFTILISTIILMIGFGIFSIATRETILSSTSREAQYSFYAADAGIECALYFQTKVPGALVDNTSFSYTISNTNPTPTCGSASSLNPSGTLGLSIDPFQFYVLVDPVQKTCARVTVYDQDVNTRRVISEGYNICNIVNGVLAPDTKNPILVERVLDTTFALH